MVKTRVCDLGPARIGNVKMANRIGTIIIGLLQCLTLAGQEGAPTAWWQGDVLVLDSAREAGIRDVTIRGEGEAVLGITDMDGRCVVRTPTKPAVLRLSHVTYGRREVRVPDQASMAVRWAMPAFVLPEVPIMLPAPEVVMRHDELDVAEFEITGDGIWVLAYGKPRMVRTQAMASRPIYQDVTLYLLDTLFSEQASVPIIGDVLALHRDFRDVVYLETTDAAYACDAKGRAILLEKVELKTLREAILPWTDSLPPDGGRPAVLVGNNDRRDFYAFDHFAFDPVAGTARVFCTAEDAFTRDLFRSQYKYMSGHDKVVAMDLALRSGIDKQVIAGYMTGFQHDRYFHPPYAPLFTIDDTLCVFDHSCGAIRKFTSDLMPCDEVRFDWHRRNLWKGALVQDRSAGTVWLIEERNSTTTLKRIDHRSGAAGIPVKLEQAYPEQVTVHDRYAYYTYKPFGAERTRWLYRERLR